MNQKSILILGFVFSLICASNAHAQSPCLGQQEGLGHGIGSIIQASNPAPDFDNCIRAPEPDVSLPSDDVKDIKIKKKLAKKSQKGPLLPETQVEDDFSEFKESFHNVFEEVQQAALQDEGV